ncbi:MAG: YicC family protein [Deferribacteraceae bacterium]|nr:YicC family protein [Deferribacteraceae bacterium]
MLKSMTGFGRAVASNAICELKIEIKTVNSKYCDINMRLPRYFSFAEIPLRALVQDKLGRGKIDVNIDAKFQKSVQAPSLNKRNFTACMDMLKQMKSLGGINDEIKLEHLLQFQDIFDYDTVLDTEELTDFLNKAVLSCITNVDAMRNVEGRHLEAVLQKLLDKMDAAAKEVDEAKNDVFLYWMNRFKTRIVDFLPKTSEHEDRIIQEAAMFAEKADIKEELARIYSHQQQFVTIMKNEYPCGKKLDFLCQELYREWNTIASKSIKVEIINAVVQAKATVDSIREQVQNIV